MSAYVKGLIGGGLIFGLGYWLMKTTAPNPDELYKKLSPDLQKQVKSPETLYDVNQIVEEMKEERNDKR
ncbi:8748_t:CDS:2 [Funneliformis caledonium]|uniref:8748_t:CDS:1 n=2 Tax=Funneliformis TaxID=1117308 RepID=A0A9N9F820_9GLOM|nr:8748_t:CDS:2 [Funneliformis caledonium]CAG8548580.1 1203_t:CDS:2 [Funneliformis mosseae]